MRLAHLLTLAVAAGIVVSSPAWIASASPAAEGAYLGAFLAGVDDGETKGVSVRRVVKGAPAESAGLRVGDIIRKIGDATITDPREVVSMIRSARPGEKLSLSIERSGESSTIEVTLGERPDDFPILTDPRRSGESEKASPPERPAFLGVGFGEVPSLLAYHLDLEPGVGIVVGDVRAGSAAAAAGIRANDVIVSVGGNEIRGGAGFVTAIRDRRAGDEVAIELIQKGERKKINVTLDALPDELQFSPRNRSWREFLPRPGDRRGDLDLFWKPFDGFRGRLHLDGELFPFKIPPKGWKDGELPEELRKRLDGILGEDEFRDQIERALRDFDRNFDSHPGFSRSSRSSVRVVEDGYDIELETENGVTRITVEKNGERVADGIDESELETLPEDVQARVKRVFERARPVPKVPQKAPAKPDEAPDKIDVDNSATSV